MINGNIDVFIISESKADETFPAAQFSLEGFCDPYRLDSNHNDSGIMLYIRGIPWLIQKKFRNNSDYFFLEINLRKKEWPRFRSCNPHKNSISTHFDFVGRDLDLHSPDYESFILLGDLSKKWQTQI